MKKNNIETKPRLSLPGFRQTNLTGFLLYFSVYATLPSLPYSGAHALSSTYLLFAIGMLLTGPFQGYLVDAFRRRNVLLYALAGIAGTTLGLAYLSDSLIHVALILLQGGCFMTAVSSSLTLSIDVTESRRRTDGNITYAIVTRTGIVTGILANYFIMEAWGLYRLLQLSALIILAGWMLMWRVQVTFHAPIEVPRFGLDRFFLPRAWLPAVDIALFAYAGGIVAALLPLAFGCTDLPYLLLLLLPIAASPTLVKMFVRLSHHCQRCTANVTLYLATDLGMIAGMGTVWQKGEGAYSLLTTVGLAVSASLLAFVLGIVPYYRHKRVR